MEERVLKQTLMHVRRGASVHEFAPDRDYVNGLLAIGLIRGDGWDITLTDLGRTILDYLESKEKW